MEEIKKISMALLLPSPFNPRKKKNAETIRELSESIKSVGLIQPLTVRPTWTTDADPMGISHYEIVCGHRRFEAAKLAELDEVTCIVRELTANQAREIMITENLQREDVDIFDESEAFAYLETLNKMSVKDIALKFGKSENYIYQRLRLQKLDHLFRELYDAADIPASHCMFICLLTPDIQTKLYREYYAPNAPSWQKLNGRSLSDVKNTVKRFTRELKFAKFDTSACASCPANTLTGCIFPEETNAKCLDEKCYVRKLVDYKVGEISSRIKGEFFLDSNYHTPEQRMVTAKIKELPEVKIIDIYQYECEKCDKDAEGVNGYSFWWDSYLIVSEVKDRKDEKKMGVDYLIRQRRQTIDWSYRRKFAEKIRSVSLDDFRCAMPKKDAVEKYILKKMVCENYGVKIFGLDSNLSDDENAAIIEGMTPEERRAAMLMATFNGFDSDDAETEELYSAMFPELAADAKDEATEEQDAEIRKAAGGMTDEEFEELLAKTELETSDEE